MGKNINEIDDTNVILNGKYITYSVLFQLCSPSATPVPFSRNLISIPKTEALKMIGKRTYLCPRHIPRTSFNSKAVWVPYQIKLRHKSTGRFPTKNKPH